MARQTLTLTAYAKPPSYSAGEMGERRRILSKAIALTRASYGYRPYSHEQMVIEVEAALMTLALIPTWPEADARPDAETAGQECGTDLAQIGATCASPAGARARDDMSSPLMVAYRDARAQIGAPVPITAQFVLECYNGLPGQGFERLDPSHVPYQRESPPAPARLALPAPDGAVAYTPEERADLLAAPIEDAGLRDVFKRLYLQGLRAYERKTGRDLEDLPPAPWPDAAAPTRASTSGASRAPEASGMASAADCIPADLRNLVAGTVAALDALDAATARRRPPATSGVEYLRRLRESGTLPSGTLPPYLLDAVEHPARIVPLGEEAACAPVQEDAPDEQGDRSCTTTVADDGRNKSDV